MKEGLDAYSLPKVSCPSDAGSKRPVCLHLVRACLASGASKLSLASNKKPLLCANCPAPAPTSMLCLVCSITQRATDRGLGKLYRMEGRGGEGRGGER